MIINIKYRYRFYAPIQTHYFINNDVQYITDWFNYDGIVDTTNLKFFKISDKNDQSSYYNTNCFVDAESVLYNNNEQEDIYNYLDDITEHIFNQVYQAKIDNNLTDDVITYLEKEIKNIFGCEYSLCKNWKYDLARDDEVVILENADGINNVYKSKFDGSFSELMEQNGFQLITKIKYNWSCDFIDANNRKKRFDCDSLPIRFEDNLLIISSKNTIFVYNKKEHAIKIYNKKNIISTKTIKNIIKNIISTKTIKKLEDITDPFKKLGIKLFERYITEEKLIQATLGTKVKLIYRIDDSCTMF